MKLKIKRFGILSLAGFGAVLGFVNAFLITLPAFFILQAVLPLITNHASNPVAGLLVVDLALYSIAGAIIGAILAAIAGLVYNGVSRLSGGVAVNLERVD